jgi:hypothetical protein
MPNDTISIINDPFQIKEYGGEIFEGKGFYYRFYSKKRLFWNNIYIPFGPVCQDTTGFENFINHIESKTFSRVTIDLPLIIDKELIKTVISRLETLKFKKIDYIHEEETILITKANFSPENKEIRYYVKKGLKHYKVETFNKLNDQQFEDMYNIYKESADRIGFIPKSKEIFKKLSENALISLAYNLESNKVEGFVMGYISNLPVRGFLSQDRANVMQILYIGTNEEARKHYIGYALHQKLFTCAFEEHNIDIIDFRGADRKKGKVYINFKKAFGGDFVTLQGPYRKDYIF